MIGIGRVHSLAAHCGGGLLVQLSVVAPAAAVGACETFLPFLAISSRILGKASEIIASTIRVALIGEPKNTVQSSWNVIMLRANESSAMGPSMAPSTMGATGSRRRS